MVRWLRFGGRAILAVGLLWIALRLVSVLFGLVSFLVRIAISAFLATVLLYLACILVSKALDRSPRTDIRRRIYE